MNESQLNVHKTPFLGPLIDVDKYPTILTIPQTESKIDAIDGPDESKLKLSGRIIHATANLPYSVHLDDKKEEYTVRQRRGNSALYGAINHLDSQDNWEVIHVAWTGEIENQDDKHKETIFKKLRDANPVAIEPIWLDDQREWRQYAENTIWPALHYIQSEPTDGHQEELKWWNDYVEYNEIYRDHIMKVYKPGDIIWIHDYYLFLLPQLLRMKLPDAYIGFFMHAPFPSSEYFRALGKRADLLEGILGANLVGTQSSAYSRHFISSATRILGVESSSNHVSAFGVHVSVESIPIGIDTVAVEKNAFRPSVEEKIEAIRALYPNKKIIVGRDRLDSVRGVTQKLQAYETFLRDYPEWRDNVVLIQVTSPTYTNPASANNVSELVSRINGLYGHLHFAPVHHYPRHIAKDEYLALLRVADLGLITSVRDGMNTTSMEFVVCQKNNNSPMILSEFTGTAGSLNEAIQVNPWDLSQVAATINQCLNASPKECAERQEKLYKYVTTHTMQFWSKLFIARLVENLGAHDRTHVTPMLDQQKLVQKYHNAKRRLFLFDYDGTLTPIVKEPSAAIPSTRLYQILEHLTSDPKNTVWIISGRDSEFLDKWLGKNEKLGFSAEHGCFLKPAGTHSWVNLAENFDMSWQNLVYDVFQSYTERTQGASIEHKRAALTWHYRRADPDFGSFQAANLRQHLEETVAEQYELEVMAGKANVEVRPKKFNKGEIVRSIVNESDEPPEFVLCLGDDYTDEDMFRALTEENTEQSEGNFPVTVGPPSKMTVAKYHLLDPEAVLDTLSMLK